MAEAPNVNLAGIAVPSGHLFVYSRFKRGQALMLIGEACPSTCDFVLIHMPPSCRVSRHKIWSAAEACRTGRFQVWAGEGDPHARACASLCFHNCQSVTAVLVHQRRSAGREKLLSVLTEAGSAWLIHTHQFSCV